MLSKAVNRAAVQAERILAVQVDGEAVALYELNGDVFATTDICPHNTCLLSENGDVLESGEVECTCHGSRFDIRTGTNTNPPSSEPLKTYPVRVEGDDVLVDLA